MNLIALYASPLGTLELQSTGASPALPGGGTTDKQTMNHDTLLLGCWQQ